MYIYSYQKVRMMHSNTNVLPSHKINPSRSQDWQQFLPKQELLQQAKLFVHVYVKDFVIEITYIQVYLNSHLTSEAPLCLLSKQILKDVFHTKLSCKVSTIIAPESRQKVSIQAVFSTHVFVTDLYLIWSA